jgi:hypothetical protein
MQESRAEIARERRRQMQVRRAFEAGLAAGASLEFYVACGRYLTWSMARLHAQDQKIHDLLRKRMPATPAEPWSELEALAQRQQRSRALMDGFARDLDRLEQRGTDGVVEFEKCGRQLVGEFGRLLLPRRNPFFRQTDALFEDGDWVEIAGASAISIRAESDLFDAVVREAPAGADPREFGTEHLPPQVADNLAEKGGSAEARR